MEIVIAGAEHIFFAKTISQTIEESAKDRGTGIARRTPEYIIQKMQNGNAVIAFQNDQFAGFLLYRSLGTWEICRPFWINCMPHLFEGKAWPKKLKNVSLIYRLKNFLVQKSLGSPQGKPS